MMIRLDLHVHSKYSFDSLMNITTIIKVAKKKNLNGLAITDHNTIAGAQKACRQNKSQLLLIVGCEIATDIGDIIGLFLTENIRSGDPFEVLDQIRLQNGISVFPHPSRGHKLTDERTIEILKKVDCIEVLSSRSPIELKEYQYLKSFNRVSVAGSDAHFPVEIGLCQTVIDIDGVDTDDVRKIILSGKMIPIGTYGPPYLQTMSQLIKNLKLRRIKPIIPQTFSLVKEFSRRGENMKQHTAKDQNCPVNNETNHRIVLDVSSGGFDKGSVAFSSIFVDEDDPSSMYLFYSGTEDIHWSHSAIGLAISRDSFEFQKISSNPILDGDSKSFREAITPAVTRVGNRFYMVFSGESSSKTSRRIGIAYSEDPKGPWQILGELFKPTRMWEGMHIDNGPSLVKLDETTFLLFYSSVTTPSKFDILAFLRRYPIRRIGIAKVRIRGPSLSKIEVYKHSANPLKHLNGAKGNWNESVFCPGYFQLKEMHFMVPAASTYSVGFPYRQYIGIVSSNTPFFRKSQTHIEKMIDGPSEKSAIIPNVKSEIAIDSPSPIICEEKNKLLLYYSVADRADSVWKIALTTFDLTDM